MVNCSSPSATPVWDCRLKRQTRFSTPSSRQNLRDPAWAWRSAAPLSNHTAVACGRAPTTDGARRFSSPLPAEVKRHRPRLPNAPVTDAAIVIGITKRKRHFNVKPEVALSLAMARLFTSQSELFRHDLFQNPPFLEQCFWSFPPFCFHWNTTYSVASLAGRRARILKQLLCFKRAIGLTLHGLGRALHAGAQVAVTCNAVTEPSVLQNFGQQRLGQLVTALLSQHDVNDISWSDSVIL